MKIHAADNKLFSTCPKISSSLKTETLPHHHSSVLFEGLQVFEQNGE